MNFIKKFFKFKSDKPSKDSTSVEKEIPAPKKEKPRKKYKFDNDGDRILEYTENDILLMITPGFRSTSYIDKNMSNYLWTLYQISIRYSLLGNSARLTSDDNYKRLKFTVTDTEGNRDKIPDDIRKEMVYFIKDSFKGPYGLRVSAIENRNYSVIQFDIPLTKR